MQSSLGRRNRPYTAKHPSSSTYSECRVAATILLYAPRRCRPPRRTPAMRNKIHAIPVLPRSGYGVQSRIEASVLIGSADLSASYMGTSNPAHRPDGPCAQHDRLCHELWRIPRVLYRQLDVRRSIEITGIIGTTSNGVTVPGHAFPLLLFSPDDGRVGARRRPCAARRSHGSASSCPRSARTSGI